MSNAWDNKPFTPKNLTEVDWSQNALSIGVELPPTDPQPWLGLSLEARQALVLVLTRQVPIERDGKIHYVPSPASAFQELQLLAKAVEAMNDWTTARSK